MLGEGGVNMLKEWIDEVKKATDPAELGMILVHNGVVRGTSKQGEPVRRMRLTYDNVKLQRLVDENKKKEGIVDIRVWINEGELDVGDDIMVLLVAGRFRTDVLPVFETVLSTIKNRIVSEQELK
jgi:molybdopterin synthase catalytic subunit